jgi:hypothetical protein
MLPSSLSLLLCPTSFVPLLTAQKVASRALEVSLKLYHPVLSVPPIFSTPALPPTVRCQSFLASPRDVLLMPPSVSVFGQHAISFLPVVIILIVCFPYFSFSCFFFSDFVCIYLFFHLFLLLVVFPFLSFYFLIHFFFLVFACNKVLSSQIVLCL